MFRDDKQIARVCRALLARVQLERLWRADGREAGPTPEAVRLLEANGGPVSSGERVMVLLAFALWNGHGGLTFADVARTLDGEHLAAVGSLLVALGTTADAVDGWLARHEPPPRLRPA